MGRLLLPRNAEDDDVEAVLCNPTGPTPQIDVPFCVCDYPLLTLLDDHDDGVEGDDDEVGSDVEQRSCF